MISFCTNCLVKAPNGELAKVADTQRSKGTASVRIQFRNGNSHWEKPERLRSGFAIGAEVEHVPTSRVNDGLGTGQVQAIRNLGGFEQLNVQFHDSGETRWLPFERLKIVFPVEKRLAQGNCGSHDDHAERFRLRVLSKMLEAWDANTGAFGRLDIDPLPHQLHVAKKVVTSGSPNWLIADDVGLGKTIEVGLILHALSQRNRCRRVLIVCPASLVRQWKEEMSIKFDRSFEIYGQNIMPDSPEELKNRDSIIVSIDLAKREKHLEMFAGAGTWDVIVFDEAHHLGRSDSGERTERFRLAELLRPLTPSLLLLTATPHQGKTGRFAALLELVRPDLKPEISMLQLNPEIVGKIVIRNQKPTVTDAEGNLIFRGHDTQRIQITPTPEMRDFDIALRRYLRRGYGISQKGKAGRAIGFVMTTYRKLASSSLEAIRTALKRRLIRLQDQEEFGHTGSVEDFLTNDDVDQHDNLNDLKAAFDHASFFDDEYDMVANLVKQAEILTGQDSKLNEFLSTIVGPLQEQNEPLLIFTEYRATQTYLHDAISNQFPDIGKIGLIHGSMKIEEKMESVASFNDGKTSVLISTEAGAEGLNMHKACHVLVNYDLPWNPSRLVQRIGRLYRYGQTKRVQVINVQVDDGFDNTAIGMMLERVEAIANDLSEVIDENREALEAQIVGELLSRIDIAEILERAATTSIERTREEMERAAEAAKDAQKIEMELLQFAEHHQGPVQGGLDGRHMMSFAEGMAAHLGITVSGYTHNNRVLEVVLPSNLVSRFPEFGRRSVLRLTATPSLARSLNNVWPLDFENRLLTEMVKAARDRSFDGMMASTEKLVDADGMCVYLLRWQSDDGELLEEEIVPVVFDGDEQMAILPTDTLGESLLQPFISADLPNTRQTNIERAALRRVLRGHWRKFSTPNRLPGAESAFAAITSS